MRILTLILLTIPLFSCTEKYINVHKPLKIQQQCIFEKFTEEERATMTESVGKKIYRNQENCRIRQQKIDNLIIKHNATHGEEK